MCSSSTSSSIIIIIIKEYYYSAVKSKKLQEHLTTEKIKPTIVSRRSITGVRLSEISKERLKISVFSRRLKTISDGDVMTLEGTIRVQGVAEPCHAGSGKRAQRV